jgi:hypothetical protein
MSATLCRKNGNVKHGVKVWKQDLKFFLIISATFSDYSLSLSLSLPYVNNEMSLHQDMVLHVHNYFMKFL